MNDRPLDVLLLLALPASGKSEVRRYLGSVDPARRRSELHLGEICELDDYPYVHAMRRIDEELVHHGKPSVFFRSGVEPMRDARDWGTLIELLNLDYGDVIAKRRLAPPSAGAWLLDRIDGARRSAGIAPAFEDKAAREAVIAGIEGDAATLLADKNAGVPDSLEGKTLVVEFARGGPKDAKPPYDGPFGYRHSLSLLRDELLDRANILYVWVTAEESRRKNVERADPAQQASILHHGVPAAVMDQDYGGDDIEWLLSQSGRDDAVRVAARGRWHVVPAVRFDNRADRTSFLRGDPATWSKENLSALHADLRGALDQLAKARA